MQGEPSSAIGPRTMASDARRLRSLEHENARPTAAAGRPDARRRGAEGSAGKELTTPQERRAAAPGAMARFGLSQRRACRGGSSTGSKTVRRERAPDCPEIGARMREIAAEAPPLRLPPRRADARAGRRQDEPRSRCGGSAERRASRRGGGAAASGPRGLGRRCPFRPPQGRALEPGLPLGRLRPGTAVRSPWSSDRWRTMARPRRHRRPHARVPGPGRRHPGSSPGQAVDLRGAACRPAGLDAVRRLYGPSPRPSSATTARSGPAARS